MFANGGCKQDIEEKWQARLLNVELIILLLTPGGVVLVNEIQVPELGVCAQCLFLPAPSFYW